MPERGDVWQVDFGITQKVRPALVISTPYGSGFPPHCIGAASHMNARCPRFAWGLHALCPLFHLLLRSYSPLILLLFLSLFPACAVGPLAVQHPGPGRDEGIG